MRRRFIVSVVVLFLYMGVIFWLSSLPSEQLTPEKHLLGFIIPQSIKHLVEYTILGFLMTTVISQMSDSKNMIILYSLLFSVGYGISDEIHQYFVPTRCCTVLDVYINAVGSIAGVILFYLIRYSVKSVKDLKDIQEQNQLSEDRDKYIN